MQWLLEISIKKLRTERLLALFEALILMLITKLAVSYQLGRNVVGLFSFRVSNNCSSGVT